MINLQASRHQAHLQPLVTGLPARRVEVKQVRVAALAALADQQEQKK